MHKSVSSQTVLPMLLTGLLVSTATARQLTVSTAPLLMNAMKTAVAGDTILVAPGSYLGDLATSGDPGNLPNGTGYFWVGNDGTALHPIVVAAQDPQNPPVLQGASISTGYVVHVTGEHVVLKNLVVTVGDKGVIFDNASYGILEDCRIFNVASELVHVRDASSYVTLSRNHLYSSGNGGNGSIGEGFYIGTDQARWGADDVAESSWGPEAIAEGYGGYDWRVDSTKILCNWASGGISAEIADIKEGTRWTVMRGNVLVGDSIGRKPGAESYDDSFIDLKGVMADITGNTFYAGSGGITKYIAEVKRSFAHVPTNLTPASHQSPWCNTGDADGNVCPASANTVVQSAPADPRSSCAEVFSLTSGTTSALRDNRIHSLQKQTLTDVVRYNLQGRRLRDGF